jgi:hypothetical protein
MHLSFLATFIVLSFMIYDCDGFIKGDIMVLWLSLLVTMNAVINYC